MGRQQSSIDQLPDDIREKLQELLRDPRVTQLAATQRINEILKRDGHPERLTKSSVNRYAVKMEEVGAKLRQAREVAQMWIGKLGAEPQGEVGKLLNEMVRSLAFEATIKLSEDDAAVEPRALKDLAIAIERLERASSENVKRDEEIRKRALDDAAKATDAVGKKKGLDPETLRVIKEEIYGIV